MNENLAIREALLYAMDEFHKVCKEHNLNYYLVGGGLIGAIRHKGFIPWDDDVDVSMLYSDYYKLLALKGKFDKPLKLGHYAYDKEYYRCTASVINEQLIVDTGAVKNNLTGATLDILCMYPTFSSKVMQKLHFKLVKFARGLFIVKGKVYLRDNHMGARFFLLRSSSFLLHFIPKVVFLKFLNIVENLAPKNSVYVANLHGAWGDKEVTDLDSLKERSLYKFEGRRYWSMTHECAHRWLTHIYGDYIKLPPEHERKYRHIAKVIVSKND